MHDRPPWVDINPQSSALFPKHYTPWRSVSRRTGKRVPPRSSQPRQSARGMLTRGASKSTTTAAKWSTRCVLGDLLHWRTARTPGVSTGEVDELMQQVGQSQQRRMEPGRCHTGWAPGNGGQLSSCKTKNNPLGKGYEGEITETPQASADKTGDHDLHGLPQRPGREESKKLLGFDGTHQGRDRPHRRGRWEISSGEDRHWYLHHRRQRRRPRVGPASVRYLRTVFRRQRWKLDQELPPTGIERKNAASAVLSCDLSPATSLSWSTFTKALPSLKTISPCY